MRNINSPPSYGAQGQSPATFGSSRVPPEVAAMWGSKQGGPPPMPQQQPQQGMAGLGQLARGITNRMGMTQPTNMQQLGPQPGPQPGMGIMPLQQGGAAAPATQPQMPQQGMAGLGQAAGKMAQMMQAAALRRRGGQMPQE